MSLFEGLPDPVAKCYPLKRAISDTPSSSDVPVEKKPLIDLIGILGALNAQKGERPEMQDEHLFEVNFARDVAKGSYSGDVQRISLYGVFDGHGGVRAARFAKQHIRDQFVLKFPSGSSFSFHLITAKSLGSTVQVEKDIKRLTLDVYKSTDEAFLKEAAKQRPHWRDGSTATTVLLVNNTLYIANIGDSAAVIARSDNGVSGPVALQLTRDHTPLDPSERERLTRVAADVRIIDGRINGQLEVSRSFGDYQFKRLGVSCLPDVKKYELSSPRDRFMLIACDGLWRCFSPQEAVDKVDKALQANAELKMFISGEATEVDNIDMKKAHVGLNDICKELVEEAIVQKLSGDNVTCIILVFTAKRTPSPKPGGEDSKTLELPN